MTISPPAIVKEGQTDPKGVLASGIDSLVIAVDLKWTDAAWFNKLKALKEAAKQESHEQEATIELGPEQEPWRFLVKPHGKDGYEWILTSRELGMTLGHWQEPRQRPSVMADIRSETLWRLGYQDAVARLLLILRTMGAEVVEVKPSRVDLCVDLLLPESEWRRDLSDHFVTRARSRSAYDDGRLLSGFSIGKGAVSARIYDKPLEILSKSHKDWMFDIWGIKSVPDGYRVIRVEYQLRRDLLREMGVRRWEHLQPSLPGLWRYCTASWLRVVDDAGLHHTQHAALPWWRAVEVGFDGASTANELVRDKAISYDRRRLAKQAAGCLTSLASMLVHERDLEMSPLDAPSVLHMAFEDMLRNCEIDDEAFTQKLLVKRARHLQPRQYDNRPSASRNPVVPSGDNRQGDA